MTTSFKYYHVLSDIPQIIKNLIDYFYILLFIIVICKYLFSSVNYYPLHKIGSILPYNIVYLVVFTDSKGRYIVWFFFNQINYFKIFFN